MEMQVLDPTDNSSCDGNFILHFFFSLSVSVDTIDALNERKIGRSTPRLSPAKKDLTGASKRSNRFGFRKSNIVRPSSTGVASNKVISFDSVASENNGNQTTTNGK